MIGLGRLGRVYARDLATRIACTRLVAVADVDQAAVDEVAARIRRRRSVRPIPSDIIGDPSVDAVVIVTPTSTHRAVDGSRGRGGQGGLLREAAVDLARRGGGDTARRSSGPGIFFQMGFMRRFDRGFAAAKQRLDEGAIGDAVVFKSTSRDPFRPSVEYADPRSSGGMIIDMGIHDFDLARWYMGEVAHRAGVGGVLAYPELGAVGDIDNAIISLVFASGRLGVVDLTRNGIYGYDIIDGAARHQGHAAGRLSPRDAADGDDQGQVAHDTVPYFMERFARRLHGAARELRAERAARSRSRRSPWTMASRRCGLRVAATRARETGQRVEVSRVDGRA